MFPAKGVAPHDDWSEPAPASLTARGETPGMVGALLDDMSRSGDSFFSYTPGDIRMLLRTWVRPPEFTVLFGSYSMYTDARGCVSLEPLRTAWHNEHVDGSAVGASAVTVVLGGVRGVVISSATTQTSDYSPPRVIYPHIAEQAELRYPPAEATLLPPAMSRDLAPSQERLAWCGLACVARKTAATLVQCGGRTSTMVRLAKCSAITLEEGTDGLFSTTTREWKAIAPMTLVRSGVQAAALDGAVYAFGGRDNSDIHVSIESYDTVQDRWTRSGAMSSARDRFAVATLEPCRAILVCGGCHSNDGDMAAANIELYDARCDGVTTLRACMPTPRDVLQGAAQGNCMYIAGGRLHGSFLGDAFIIDVTADSVLALPDLPRVRGRGVAAFF